MATEAEIEAAARAIADIPVSGGAYMALYQETFSMTVSRELLGQIAKVALLAAERVRANSPPHSEQGKAK